MGPGDTLLDAPPLSHGIGLAVVFVVGLPIVGFALLFAYRIIREDVRRIRENDRTRRRGFGVLPPGKREDQR